MYRHGDVLLRPITQEEFNRRREIRDVWRETVKYRDVKSQTRKKFIVARGEMTGHHHTLTAEKGGEIEVLRIEGMETLYIDVKKGAVLTHQEHKTLNIPEGLYEVVRQREYDPGRDREFRPVID